MSFGDFEASAAEGSPISLLFFRYGTAPANYYAYTDHELDLTYNFGDGHTGTNPVTYKSVPLWVDEVTASGTLDKKNITVSMPESVELADLFRYRPPSTKVTMIIRQGHEGDPDHQFLVGWSGKVIGFDIPTNDLSLTCEPIGASMLRTGLRRRYQIGCPHALYGPKCQANKEVATISKGVVSINGAEINVGPVWPIDLGRVAKFVGGMVEWTRTDGRVELRTILDININGNTWLSHATDGLNPGDTVKLTFGCNHKSGIPLLNDGGDCLPLHNSIQNYGGQLWIPTTNPIGIKNNYY